MSMRTFLSKLLPLAPRATNIYKYEYLQCDPSKCYYCSNKATALDHVLPISLAKLLPYYEFPSELLVLVPCCTRCNSVAGNRYFTTLASKKKFILERVYELKVRAEYAEMIDRLEKLLSKKLIV